MLPVVVRFDTMLAQSWADAEVAECKVRAEALTAASALDVV